ncbi:MAG: hypothetical protein KDD42_02675 [Bdellovibrionales bacterium]|nr:hypothetical protein [Bdellovibrionales bacterium]
MSEVDCRANAVGKKVTFIYALLALFLICSPHSSFAQPAGFKMFQIAGPNGAASYPYYSYPAINENGEVCFRGASNTETAILKGNGSSRSLVGVANSSASSFGSFVSGICSINAAGDVVFDACTDCPFQVVEEALGYGTQSEGTFETQTATFDEGVDKGIYKSNGSGTAVKLIGTGINPTDFKSVSLPTINKFGDVVFAGELNDGTQGVWLTNGGNLTAIFDSNGSFASLGGPFVNDNAEATFAAREDSSPNITGLYGPTANRVVSQADGFSHLGFPVINNSGSIAYLAKRIPTGFNIIPENGVYVNGQPRVLNSSGAFATVTVDSDFAGARMLAINDLGDIVFSAYRANGNSVAFLSLDGGLLKLFETGDSIPGYSSPVQTVIVGRESINSKRQIALVVILQDATHLVVRLEPDGSTLPQDSCPDDPNKFDQGVCGCGVADFDSNADGVYDCEVTQVLYNYSLDLSTLIRKLKPITAKTSKKKKKQINAIKKQVATQRTLVFDLATGSTTLVQVHTGADYLKMFNGMKKAVNKSLKINSSAFAKNKRKAIGAVKKFQDVLNVTL